MNIKEELSIAEKLLTDVASKYPHIKKSNTEAIIYCIEELAHRKGYDIVYDDIWMVVKDIMRTRGYCPETISRAKRKLWESTSAQKEREQQFHEEFNLNNPSMG